MQNLCKKTTQFKLNTLYQTEDELKMSWRHSLTINARHLKYHHWNCKTSNKQLFNFMHLWRPFYFCWLLNGSKNVEKVFKTSWNSDYGQKSRNGDANTMVKIDITVAFLRTTSEICIHNSLEIRNVRNLFVCRCINFAI